MADPYAILYVPQAVQDIRRLTAFGRANVMDGIETHLRHEPTKVSRSRIKRMTQPFWTPVSAEVGRVPRVL
jgi:hypothetical protein